MAHASQSATNRGTYYEAVSRLAGIRHSLALMSADGAGPAPDLDSHCDEVAEAASAGLNALAAVSGDQEASREMVERIRRELAEISNLVLR